MRIAVSLFLISLAAFAQSDRGTITGTISDPAGAVVASAAIEARSVQTGAVYNAASSTTGNYTLAQLPAGAYEMTVTVPGFKKYVRQNIEVQVAQTLRIDVGLEVGANTESVTVTAEVTLLKTESGELSHVVTSDRLDSLPILNVSSGGIRSPWATTQLVPGATWRPNLSVRVNGAPANTQALRIEGQDSTNGLWATTPGMTQPSVDAIQEFAIQTNNYAAEFGQAGGGLFNLTMRSGTNQFHGSAYEYFVNDALNGNQPFINARPVRRRNDYGFTVGGPVWIPKVYNGHDRTFFFLNWERYKDTQTYNNIPQTVPTAAYRAGDFSAALTGATIGTDSLQRPILEGQVYDPRSQRVVDGFTVRDPFPGNRIDPTFFDPVARKIQEYIPQPNRPGLTNNYLPVFVSPARTTVPALKVDQLLGSRSKVSFYWSRTDSATTNLVGFGQADGFPTPITQARGSFTTANTYRLSYDQTISPTLLLHLGAGWVRFFFRDDAPELNFDTGKTLGLKGTYGEGRFPYFTGLCPVPFPGALCGSSGTGGMTNMGPLAQSLIHEEKPTANVSVTWVRSNHTYKAGAEMVIDGYPSQILGASVVVFNFSN